MSDTDKDKKIVPFPKTKGKTCVVPIGERYREIAREQEPEENSSEAKSEDTPPKNQE